ncbi:hypothetical protein M0R45_025754 [Rubus argutus]|uniref:Uncharacterized protein n=1 Tax=Rubus argutus TaxID=59490 RepID=A0AAW1WX59_RUBAR
MNGAEVGVLEQTHPVGLRRLLKRRHRVALQSDIGLQQQLGCGLAASWMVEDSHGVNDGKARWRGYWEARRLGGQNRSAPRGLCERAEAD